MMFMVFFFYLIFSFFIFFSYSVWMFKNNMSIMLEWTMISYGSMNLEYIVLLDWISMVFISLVSLISSMIFIYSVSYMMFSKFQYRFMILVFLFVISMIIMIISPNIFSIMFGWDSLGLVSYCLVIFYNNSLSYCSGMVTVLSNRVGDVGLLMAIGIGSMWGSWNISVISGQIMSLLIVGSAITKSAQIPFSSWLPMAMAAPTPVSALVHSSTLVTAGVYLIIRFNSLIESGPSKFMLMILSVSTMFMSGIMANVEYDLKKIIALSTLGQLGLMMMSLSMGFTIVCFYHLMTHAIFKSVLFMCAGIMIHSMGNNQDIRCYGNLNELIPFTMMSFCISSFSLMGMPFLSGFYSKDLIMEMVYLSKSMYIIFLMALFSLIFTVSYSVRLMWYIFFGSFNNNSYVVIKDDEIMGISMMILMLLSIILGSSLSWLFMFDFPAPILSEVLKMLTMSMCLLGIIVGLGSYLFNMGGIYWFLWFFSSMWFMNFFISYIHKPVVVWGKSLGSLDKLWFEFMGSSFFFYVINNFTKFSLNSFKMFMFTMLFIYMILLLFFMVYN